MSDSYLYFNLDLNPLIKDTKILAEMFDKLARLARYGEFDRASKVHAQQEVSGEWTVTVTYNTTTSKEF